MARFGLGLRAPLGSYYFIMGTCKQRPCAFHHSRNDNCIMKKEKKKKSKIKDVHKACDVWRWASVGTRSMFLLFGSHFLCCLSLTPLRSLCFWCGCSRFCWGYMSHLFPLGVTVMEPSSHCVHPEFPFQDASYSEPYLVKNKPEKMKWDVEEKRWSRGERGGAEQMWKGCSALCLAHLDICRMWQTVLKTAQKVLIFFGVSRSILRRTKIEFSRLCFTA